MPVFTYEVLDNSGKVVEVYEAEQSFGADPLRIHPVTGERMRKVLTAPRVNTTYTDWNNKLEPGRLSKAGFTQYQRDKTTGRYFKTNTGKGPQELDPHAGA